MSLKSIISQEHLAAVRTFDREPVKAEVTPVDLSGAFGLPTYNGVRSTREAKEIDSSETAKYIPGMRATLATESVELEEAPVAPLLQRKEMKTGRKFARAHEVIAALKKHNEGKDKKYHTSLSDFVKNHTQLGEDFEAELAEMAMGVAKNKAGKKVEWHNVGGNHMVTVGGVPAHTGFLSHDAASTLYKKHLAEDIELTEGRLATFSGKDGSGNDRYVHIWKNGDNHGMTVANQHGTSLHPNFIFGQTADSKVKSVIRSYKSGGNKAALETLNKHSSVKFQHELEEEMNTELEESSGTPKVKTNKYSWGTMKVIHHGADFSVPLHPEHHQAISKLADQETHKFTDETGKKWNAKRDGDNVHFTSGSYKTRAKLVDMKEEVELEEGSISDELKKLHDEMYPKKTSKGAAINAARDEVGGGKVDPIRAAKQKRENLLNTARKTVRRSETIIDHEDAHPAGEPDKHPHTAAGEALANHPWVPKVKTAAKATATKVSQGVTTSGAKQAKASDYAIERLKQKAAKGDRAAKLRLARLKVESFEFSHDLLSESTDNTASIELEIVKEGFSYFYTVSTDGDVLKEGVGITKNGIFAETARYVMQLIEDYKRQEGQLDRVKSIINNLTSQ